jgi:hypothetical protein
MKFKEKILILFIAVVVSVLGFNLIASSSVCLLKVAKEAGNESIESYLTKCDDKASQFARLSPDSRNSK